MIKQFAEMIRPILDFPIVRRTRRNHALEHATIHMLSRRNRTLRVAGRSSDGGFILIGDVPQDQVESAAYDALSRLKKGERSLALHPNCGTNLVTTGFMTTLAGYIGLRGGNRDNHVADRFSLTMILVMVALMISPPIGMSLQKHITTDGDPGDLEIVSIKRRQMSWFGRPGMVIYNVSTRRG
ncbi:MAG: DUF6391 domain-containing protein [Aggregatilineales bacterium]